jgi:hypothetical protein
MAALATNPVNSGSVIVFIQIQKWKAVYEFEVALLKRAASKAVTV